MTLSTSEKIEKVCDDYVRRYECNKHSFNSMYGHTYAEQEMTISKMKDIEEIYNYDIKEICSKTNTCEIIFS